MLKHILIIILLSIAILFTMPHIQLALQYLLMGHDWIADNLKLVFTGGEAGSLIRELIALLAIPFLVSFIVAGLYWVVKRHWFPYYIYCVWFVWLIQAAALVAIYTPKKV